MEHLVSILTGPLRGPTSRFLMALAFPRLVSAMGLVGYSKYKFRSQGQGRHVIQQTFEDPGLRTAWWLSQQIYEDVGEDFALSGFFFLHAPPGYRRTYLPCGSCAEGSRISALAEFLL